MKRVGVESEGVLARMALVLFMSASATFAADDKSAPPAALMILENTFRQERTDRLREVMSPGRKVYLNSPSLGIDAGYYSPDQVCLLMQEIFRTRMTVRFNLLKGTDPPKEASRVVVDSRWTYRRGRSKEQTLELAFT